MQEKNFTGINFCDRANIFVLWEEIFADFDSLNPNGNLFLPFDEFVLQKIRGSY